jgi:hypothetical protein
MRRGIGFQRRSLPKVGAAACPWIGAKSRSRAGSGHCSSRCDARIDETFFHFVEDFGEITAGTRLAFPHARRVSGELNGRSYLPVDAAGAEIVASDGQGRPALLRNPLGSGCAVLCTYTLEYLAARNPRVEPFEVAAIARRSAVGRDRATERGLVLQATSMVGRAERRDAGA